MAKVNMVYQPIAPSHPIVISCINGGDLPTFDSAEAKMSNYFIPPFAPLFTPRDKRKNKEAPLVVSNTKYIKDSEWMFLGIAFTGCTLDEARKLSMEASRPFRVAVIVGGSCTVPGNTSGTENFNVTDLVGFKCESEAELQAPGVPESYKQSFPTKWNLKDQIVVNDSGIDTSTSVVIVEGTKRERYMDKEDGIRMAGVILDQDTSSNVRILLK